MLPLDRDFLDGVAEASRDGNDLAVPRKALLATLRQHRLPERGVGNFRAALRVGDARRNRELDEPVERLAECLPQKALALDQMRRGHVA